MKTIAEKRATFRELHSPSQSCGGAGARGCFVIPNPWTSEPRVICNISDSKRSRRLPPICIFARVADGRVGCDAMLAHVREIAQASDLPVNADFENGYSDDANSAAQNVRLCVEAGAGGVSLEDNSGRKDKPLYEIEHATERIRAAHEAIHGSGALLVARAECFLVGVEAIDEVIRRLTSYANAGADCLYAPGISKREDVKAVVDAVAPKPVNLLISAPGGLTMRDAAELGVRRVSVGGALARAAWGSFLGAAKMLAEQGTFDGFADAAPHRALNDFFTADMQE